MARVLKEATEADYKAIAAAAEQSEESQRAAADAGGGIYFICLMLACIWVGGVGGAVYLMVGPQRLLSLGVPEIAAIAAIGLLPALMVLVAGLTAREGARARAEARRLADAADQLLSPAPGAEAAARRLAVAVRGEIAALDRALAQTLVRLKSVEGEITKQSDAVDAMADQAKSGTGNLIHGMERERAELMRISEELNKQAHSVSQSVFRHTHAISEAARLAEHEVRAADEALETRITSFGAAAALISDRTQALTMAAQASAESALRLETALSSALDILAKATQLTDAARESAQAATLAANSSATSVRNTTSRAVEEARRAAEAMRGEAAAVERESADALERLRDAANSARTAAHDVRGAIEPQQPPRPTSFMRSPAELSRPRPEAKPPMPAERFNLTPPAAPEPRDADARHTEPAARSPAAPTEPGGAWTWRELLSAIDEHDNGPSRASSDLGAATPPRAPPPGGDDFPRRPLPREPLGRRQSPPQPAAAEDPIARLTQAVSDPRGGAALPAAQAIERAGVRLNETFSRGALDRIAQRARNGTQSRRQAVRGAAPDAVNAIADFLDRDAAARQEAARFLKSDGARIAELLGRGRATMTADATRVFLLLDAAAS